MNRTLLTLTFALLSSTAALATPVLKGDIAVNADIVTVGDMFDNAGELSETAIFRAPAPGTTGLVPLSDVTAAAHQIGLADFDNVGFTRVRVARLSTTVDAATLDGLINENLHQRGVVNDGVTAEPHFDVGSPSFNAAQVATPVTLTDIRYSPGTGTFAARFTVAGIDKPVDLTGRIDLMTTAPRLIATQPAGTILSPADFEMAPVAVSTADAGGYADINQLVGKQLVRQSHAGVMLKDSDVAEPTVVTRNTPVMVLFKSGAMTLTIKGQALGTASAGQSVDVLNPISRKVLHGIAQADGSVALLTAQTIASL
jgi:flagella basal body P-ring formation protein FlgA